MLALLRRGALVAALLLSFLPGVLLAAAPQEPRTPADPAVRLRVRAEQDLRTLVSALVSHGLDVTYADPKQGVVELVGGSEEISLLRTLGLEPEVLEGPLGPEALADYLSPAEIEARLAQYEASYPAIAKRFPYAVDHEGRTAWALKISDNVTVEEDEPAVLYVAQHHAREVMTPEVAIDTIDQLLTLYGTDPVVTRWVDEAEIFVLPTHNPDGADYVFTTDYNWRKNRRNNGDGSYGVDLNRNYPFAWNACGGSAGAPGDDLYRGPSPGSEPTTAGLIDLVRQERPVYYVTYHTYGQYALHPYGCEGVFQAQPDFQTFRELANEVSARMLGDQPGSWYRFGTPWELLYAVDGDSDGWLYGEMGSVGVTFELNAGSQGFQPDYATWRDSTVLRARPGWRYFLERLDGPRLTGHVSDACSGAPLPLSRVALAEQLFSNGESPRTTTPDHARYDWPVLPGHYTLEVSRDGYLPQSWPTDVGFAPFAREVRLVPAGARDAAVLGARIDDAGGDGDLAIDPGETVDLYLSAVATGEALASLTAGVSTTDPYLTIVDGSTSFGALAAGETREASAGDPLRIAFAPDTPDGHEAEILVDFDGDPAPCGTPRPFVLRATTGIDACPAIEERLDADPGWQIDNGVFSGGWEFGVPSPGGPGPATAYTGTNVYGTNLDGNYADGAAYTLTAGPYDLATLRRVELRFARWLRTEPGYDIARVEVRTGGAPEWHAVWEGFGRDLDWVPVRYDVSRLVDGEPEVYVRFSLTTDNGAVSAGFYVDDLLLCGEQLPSDAARVKYRSHSLDDSDPAYGNGNGLLDPGETATLLVETVNSGGAPAVAVSAILEPLTAGVRVHNDVADYPDLLPGAVALSLPPHFTVTLDGPCGPDVSFRLLTRWGDGATTTSSFTVPVGSVAEETRLSDDFEVDRGWTVGGTTVTGRFVRQNPNGVTDASVGVVQPEDDRTPAPGVTAWVTGNPAVGPGFDPKSGDVDKGSTSISSPIFDGSGDGRLILRFSRFYHRSGVSFLQSSYARAQVSTDGGANWQLLEELSSSAASWTDVEFDLTSRLTPTASMRLRFEAEERTQTAGDPLTELLVDEVRVIRRYEACLPFLPAETHPPNPVGATLAAVRRGTDVALSWIAPPVDGAHDAARFYPVYRSVSPSGGFAPAGEPTATGWRDTEGAATSGSFFYVVAAKNAAGTSGEEPVP